MGKKSKSSKKRAQRRDRAKLRADGIIPEDEISSQEAEADEAVSKAAEAESESQSARDKKAPKPVKDEERENAWERLKRFYSDVKIEALKINWPSSDETWKSTWVTVFVIIVLSVFMGFCSIGFQRLSENLFGVTQITNTSEQATVNTTDTMGAGAVEDTGTGDVDPVDPE